MAKDAEAVMAALKSTLEAYTSGSWASISLNRDLESEPYTEADCPAINLEQSDENYTLLGSTLQDNDLQVFLTAYAYDDGVTDPKTMVNNILREIQTAILAPWYSGSTLLGLSYVWDLLILNGGSMTTNSSGNIEKAARTMLLSIKYRTEHQNLGG